MTTLPDPARFAHVTDWVFDLDNTLYPHHSNLFAQIDVKMTSYVEELLRCLATMPASCRRNSTGNMARR